MYAFAERLQNGSVSIISAGLRDQERGSKMNQEISIACEGERGEKMRFGRAFAY